MKTQIGLLLLTHIESGELAAVLQRRSETCTGPEKIKSQSWPGTCELTFPAEDFHDDEKCRPALLRIVNSDLVPYVKDQAVELLSDTEEDGVHRYIFGILVGQPAIRALSWKSSSGGIQLLPRSKISTVLDRDLFDKDEGNRDRQVIALPQPDKAAVEKAFEVFA